MKASDERELALRGRFPREAEQLLGPSAYRSNGLLVRIVFFLLALLAMGAGYLFLSAFDMPLKGTVTGVAAIAIAETLIWKRWRETGVEEGLWIGACFAIISDLPSSGRPESLLVMAAAAAIPGARLRNPLFGAIAAAFVVGYAERVRDLGVVAALAVATIGGLALLREWRRPSTEWLWIGFAVLFPPYGRIYGDQEWRTTTIALYAAIAIVMLTLAFARRHHALLVAGLVAMAIAVADAAERIDAPLELKLGVGGALLLGGTFVVSRALRDRARGVVVTPERLTPIDEALEAAGTIAAAQAVRPAEVSSSEGPGAGEGRFGGGGASGSY
ncbi:MAG TPA: hypothetical protein VFO89_17170 [Thermoanaerobaculia bacterium]|nr:hypothetical protein [Thermoanaerobaculia bacterium]